tara:strand:- start:194 stop:346 length:153 start_codon:yes stop_codon:yes gene_type:complete
MDKEWGKLTPESMLELSNVTRAKDPEYAAMMNKLEALLKIKPKTKEDQDE